jgi:hypothetical protein
MSSGGRQIPEQTAGPHSRLIWLEALRPPCYALCEMPGIEGFRLRKEIPAGNGINIIRKILTGDR